MEFADWVVAGLDRLRLGQLPGGQGLYQSVSMGLGGNPALDAFMNTGDPAARARLVQLIAQATAANPGFEHQLRASAATAQGGGSAVRTPFLKSSNGIVVLVAAAVLVVGGGVGLAVGLSGGSSSGSSGGTSGALGANPGAGKGGGSSLVSAMKGTWTCTGVGAGGTVTIGDGTWSTGGDSGTWTVDAGKATLTSKTNPGDDIAATGVPSAPGAFDITAAGPSDGSSAAAPAHLTGTVSAHQLKVTLAVPGSDMDPSITCTK